MTKEGGGMKSSYELAMERLDKAQGKMKSLTSEQKERIAEVESKKKARLAELDLVMEGQVSEARQAGDPIKLKELEERRVNEIGKINAEAETNKETIRQG